MPRIYLAFLTERLSMSSSFSLADHFRAIAELRGDIAWIVDCASSVLTYISPSAEALLGYTPSAVARQLADSERDGPLAELCGGLAERLRRFAAGDRSRARLVREFDLPRSDGSTLPVEVDSILVCDEAGTPVSLAGTIRDISERRAFAAAQRRFASMLNHEFRTPLSIIDGAIQLLEVRGANADLATRQRYRKIGAAVDRMVAMLDEYLSPDRVVETGHKRREGHADPRRLLEEGAALARAAGHGATVQADALPSVLRCAADGLRLAIKAMVGNAVQYSPPGSVINLSGGLAGGGVELLVRDRGEGVPPDEIALIFNKFYRGSNAGSRPGSGLGLYMARSVAEAHGGALDVRNHEECGAEFRLWLPVSAEPGKKVAPGPTNSDNSRIYQG